MHHSERSGDPRESQAKAESWVGFINMAIREKVQEFVCLKWP